MHKTDCCRDEAVADRLDIKYSSILGNQKSDYYRKIVVYR